ncbi:MAG: TRAP transporter substrate-binding protein [Gammaproteobacteria bacterium]|nr:TRAP transporter substrate-binding protein [Gammaproteobacteria bacterium]
MTIVTRLAAATAAILVLAVTGCNSGTTEGQGPVVVSGPPPTQFKWKMVTTWPPGFPIFQTGVDRFAEDVRVMSGGELDIKVFAGNELVPPLQTFDAVSQGTVEMGHGAAYYWAGKVPAAQFMSAVPFGMTAKGMHSWFYSGGGLELWQELYEPFNLVPFPMGNSGVQMGGWFNKRIDSLADLEGLKMRIPGLGGRVLAKAGGTPVLMAGGEIYTALERNTLDATEWVGPYHDKRLGLDRAADYYYYPGWHEPGTALELIVNKGAWDSLPERLQRIVRVAAMATNLWAYSQFETLNLQALRELRQEGRVNILPFPDEVLVELQRLTRETLEEEAAGNADFRRVYEAYKAFRADNDAWNEISDDAYHRARGLGAGRE